MQITCPSCNTAYKIRKNGIPPGKTGSATCRKCGNKITIHIRDAYTGSTGPAIEDLVKSPVTPNPGAEQSLSPSDAFFETTLIGQYPELSTLDLEKYDLKEIFFKNRKGEYQGRKNREIAKNITAVHGVLEKILKAGERAKKICWGTAYYPSEILFGNGFLTMLYNRYVMVATDLRLLFINVNYRMNRPAHYFFQLPFQDIKRMKRGIFGKNLTFYKLKTKRRHFMGVKSYLSKEMIRFVTHNMGTSLPDGRVQGQPEDLCPACFDPLEKGLVRCTHCWAEFKKPRRAFLRSLLLPGLGDFYLGHRFLGVLEITGSAVVWFAAVSLSFTGVPVNIMISAGLLLWVNGLDGLLTYHMAKKGYELEHKKEGTASPTIPKSGFEAKTGMLVQGA
jgi:predicted Zn finger-like uncharacterized protein